MLGGLIHVVRRHPTVLDFLLFAAVLISGLSLTSCAVTSKSPPPQTDSTISVVPSSVSFGNVKVKSDVSKTVKLTNKGKDAVKLSQVKATGSGFSISGLSAPATLAPGASATLTITYKPVAPGTSAGNVVISNDATDSPVMVNVVGTGVAATTTTSPAISVTPSEASFGNVTVNTEASQTIKLSNTGTADLSISQVKATGSGFSISGLAAPTTVAAGSSVNFTIAFKPKAAGAESGNISITNDSSDSPLVIDMTGAGVTSTVKLSASVSSVNFGNVAVGKTVTEQVKLSNTGNAEVNISGAAASGTGFGASGGSNVNLAPNQSVNVTVSFDPQTKGTLSGNLTVSSNAATLKIPLSGTGTQQAGVQHTVSLTWTASTSDVIGYFVYRRTGATGAFVKLQSAVDSNTSFTDSNVQDGDVYFYVVTAVDADDLESAFSSQVQVTIPSS